MAASRSSKAARDEVIAVDVGTRVTKAVVVQRKGAEWVLQDYAFIPTPPNEKSLSVAELADLLRQAVKALKTNCRRVVLTLGPGPMVLTHVDLPLTNPADLRKMIKLSPKSYVQQDLPDHLFDCFFRKPVKGTDTVGKRRKSKVLVGAARRRVVEDWCDAAKQAGLSVVQLTFVPVALANAFRLLRDDSHPDPVALLDIGASASTINIVHQGELAFTRTVALGADKFADVLSPTGGKATGGEGEEEASSEGLQARLQKAILSFSREVDASVGFYSSQQERHVSQLFVSGGTARSQLVLQLLESELSFSCEGWNLVRHIGVALPEQRQRELEYEIPQLTVAIGAAVGALREDGIRINLLAEEQETAEQRRRDPVRRGVFVAAGLVTVMLAWTALLGFQGYQKRQELAALSRELTSLKATSGDAIKTSDEAIVADRRVAALLQHGAARFLQAPILDALQYVVPDEITLTDLEIRRFTWSDQLINTNSLKRIEVQRAQYRMTAKGRNQGDATAITNLTATVTEHPFFKSRLDPAQPATLLGTQRPTGGSTDPTEFTSGFTVQFFFTEEPPATVGKPGGKK